MSVYRTIGPTLVYFLHTACDVELLGGVCSSECDCVAENSQTGTSDCDVVTGLCLCLPGWTGNTCNMDVDECDTGAHNCGSNVCLNTPGSFNCECEQGTGGNCDETDSGKYRCVNEIFFHSCVERYAQNHLLWYS